jgi:hypothetical protein
VENLVNACHLGGCWGRGIGIDELGETEDRIERRAKLMAHAGKGIRFREVGFFHRGPGALQFDFIFLQRLLEAFAFRDVARSRIWSKLLIPITACKLWYINSFEFFDHTA